MVGDQACCRIDQRRMLIPQDSPKRPSTRPTVAWRSGCQGMPCKRWPAIWLTRRLPVCNTKLHLNGSRIWRDTGHWANQDEIGSRHSFYQISEKSQRDRLTISGRDWRAVPLAMFDYETATGIDDTVRHDDKVAFSIRLTSTAGAPSILEECASSGGASSPGQAAREPTANYAFPSSVGVLPRHASRMRICPPRYHRSCALRPSTYACVVALRGEPAPMPATDRQRHVIVESRTRGRSWRSWRRTTRKPNASTAHTNQRALGTQQHGNPLSLPPIANHHTVAIRVESVASTTPSLAAPLFAVALGRADGPFLLTAALPVAPAVLAPTHAVGLGDGERTVN